MLRVLKPFKEAGAIFRIANQQQELKNATGITLTRPFGLARLVLGRRSGRRSGPGRGES